MIMIIILILQVMMIFVDDDDDDDNSYDDDDADDKNCSIKAQSFVIAGSRQSQANNPPTLFRLFNDNDDDDGDDNYVGNDLATNQSFEMIGIPGTCH